MSRIHDQIDAYIEGTLRADEAAALDTELRAASDLRRELIVRLDMHAALGWRARGPQSQTTESPVPSTAPAGWIGPAVAIAAALLILGAVAAVYFAGFGPNDAPERPERPVAVLLGSNGAQWISSNPIEVGQDVTDTRIELADGTIQMQLNGGGAVTVNGNSSVYYHSPRHASLSRGWMRVRNAPGFRVDLPSGVTVVDISTEFEVSVSPEGIAGVRVIEGEVRIEPTERDAAPRVMNVGDVMAIDADGRILDDPIRWIPATGLDDRPVIERPLPGTGDQKARWEIVRATGDDTFEPHGAVVLSHVDPTYVRPADSDAQWVSVDAPGGVATAGAMFTFRATVDLVDVDPQTVKVNGRFAVDNRLVSIRINGHEVARDETTAEGFRDLSSFEIDSGWVSGENRIEFDVLNGEPGIRPNPMALWVDWNMTAMPDWIGR